MHDKILNDIEKRISEGTEKSLTEIYISTINYLSQKEDKNSKFIENMLNTVGDSSQLNILIQMSEYLSPVGTEEIHQVIDDISTSKVYPEELKGDAIYAIASIYEHRFQRSWFKQELSAIPEIAKALTAEKSIPHYEKSENTGQFKKVCREVADYKIKYQSEHLNQEALTYYRKILLEISKEIVSKGKMMIRRIPYPMDSYDLPEDQLLKILDEITEILTLTLNHGLEDLVRQYSDGVRNLKWQNRKYFEIDNRLSDPNDLQEWEDKMRKMRLTRIICEFEAIADIPKNWKKEDRGEKSRRQSYHNQTVAENIANLMKNRMDEMTLKVIENLISTQNDQALLEIYKDGMRMQTPSNKFMIILQRSYKRKEFHEQAAKIIQGLTETNKLALIEEIYHIKKINNVITMKRETEKKLEIQIGLLKEILKKPIVESDNIKKIKIVLEEISNQANEVGRYDIVIDSHKMLMQSQLSVNLDYAVKSFKIQNEINKMYGDRIEGVNVGLDFIEEMMEYFGDKELKSILSDLQTDYEINVTLSIYNNVMLEKIAKVQLDRLKSFET